jgi:hypothetical protein
MKISWALDHVSNCSITLIIEGAQGQPLETIAIGRFTFELWPKDKIQDRG